MKSRIDEIKQQVLENKDLYNPTDANNAIDEVANKVLEACLDILRNEQGSMNKKSDHVEQLANEILWKMLGE